MMLCIATPEQMEMYRKEPWRIATYHLPTQLAVYEKLGNLSALPPDIRSVCFNARQLSGICVPFEVAFEMARERTRHGWQHRSFHKPLPTDSWKLWNEGGQVRNPFDNTLARIKFMNPEHVTVAVK